MFIESDLHASGENIHITLPSWFDKDEDDSSFFLNFRSLFVEPFLLFGFLVVIGPLCIVLTQAVVGNGHLSSLAQTLLATIVTALTLKQVFDTLKVLQVLVSSYHWPAPSAIVVGSFVRRWKSKDKPRHDFYVVCAYQADNNIYYSTVPSKDAYGIAFALVGSETYKSWGNYSDEYLEHKEREFSAPCRMTVYHHPLKPQMVLHRNGFHYDGLALLTGMMMLLFLLGLFSYAFWVMK